MNKLNAWDFSVLFVFCSGGKYSLAITLLTFLIVVTKCPRKGTAGRGREGGVGTERKEK